MTRRAERDFRNLRPKIVRQLQTKVLSLADDPRPQDRSRVLSQPGILRVDSGEYRILYSVDDTEQLVVVQRVRQRREAYR